MPRALGNPQSNILMLYKIKKLLIIIEIILKTVPEVLSHI